MPKQPVVKPISDKDLRRALAQVMEERRTELEYSQEKLAELSELSVSYISMLERGKRNMTVLSAARLAAALDLQLSAFVKIAEAKSKE